MKQGDIVFENLRAYAQINLDNIRHNVEEIQNRVGEDTGILAVIKADGYGHGSIPIARYLSKEKLVYGFGVSTYREAVVLRKGGINEPILILGYVFPGDFEGVLRYGITTTVFQYETAKFLSDVAVMCGMTANIHIKIDTGMGRIGFDADDESIDEIERISKLPNINIEGIFSHFACADSADKTSANEQEKKFFHILSELEDRGMQIPIKHICNSAGIVDMTDGYLDLVRAGIVMYGLYPSDQVNKAALDLKPAMEIKSRVVYVKTVKKDTTISYGSTYIAKKGTKIATVSLGYADGYYRSLSSKGEVLIRGQRAKIVGRICMDQMMVDVTDIPDVCQGDIVTVFGKDGNDEITFEEMSNVAGTFNYEFICGFARRVPRIYFEHGRIIRVLDYLEETI